MANNPYISRFRVLPKWYFVTLIYINEQKYNIDLTETNFKDMRINELYDSVTDGELLIVANEMANTGYTQELLIGIMHILTNIELENERRKNS